MRGPTQPQEGQKVSSYHGPGRQESLETFGNQHCWRPELTVSVKLTDFSYFLNKPFLPVVLAFRKMHYQRQDMAITAIAKAQSVLETFQGHLCP